MSEWLQQWQGVPSWSPAWDVMLILGIAFLTVLVLVRRKR